MNSISGEVLRSLPSQPHQGVNNFALTTSDPIQRVHPPPRSIPGEEALAVRPLCHCLSLSMEISRPLSLCRILKILREGLRSYAAPLSRTATIHTLVLGSPLNVTSGQTGRPLLFRRTCSIFGVLGSPWVDAMPVLGVMTSTTLAAVPQGRKRRCRQVSHARADATRSSTGTFPRVATAPANLASSSTAAATTRAGVSAKARRPSSPAFGDTSVLDAQISTLALIRAYGYGVVPGTPLRRDNKASASAGGSRCRTAMHGARDLRKSSGTEGSSPTGYDSSTSVGKAGEGEQQAKKRVKPGSTKPNREPWVAPLDSRVGQTQQRSAVLRRWR